MKYRRLFSVIMVISWMSLAIADEATALTAAGDEQAPFSNLNRTGCIIDSLYLSNTVYSVCYWAPEKGSVADASTHRRI